MTEFVSHQEFFDLETKVSELRFELNLVANWIASRFGNEESFPNTLNKSNGGGGAAAEQGGGLQSPDPDVQTDSKIPIPVDPVTDAEAESQEIDNIISALDDDDVSFMIENDSLELGGFSDSEGIGQDEGSLSLKPTNHHIPKTKVKPCSVQLVKLDDSITSQFVKHHQIIIPAIPLESSAQNEDSIGSPMSTDTEDPEPTITRPRKTYACTYTECAKIFARKHHLTVHLRSHTGERPFTCEFCGSNFAKEMSLNIHRRSHTGERPYACNLCPSTFKGLPDLRAHKSNEHPEDKQWKCKYCNILAFNEYNDLEEHIQSIHHPDTNPTPFICHICGKTFDRSAVRTKHQKSHIPIKPFPCTVCGKRFSRAKDRDYHLASIHGETSETFPKLPIDCKICGKPFTNPRRLQFHTETHSGYIYDCKVCGKVFNNSSALHKHQLAMHKPRTKKKVYQQVSHEKLNLILQSRREKIEDRAAAAAMKNDEQKLDKPESDNSIQQTYTRGNPYKCTVPDCGKSFKSKPVLARHNLIHTGEKPFECEACGKRVRTKEQLKAHSRLHTGEKPYKCKVCGKCLSTCYGLQRHVLVNHEERIKVKCNNCGKEFIDERNLKGHRKKCLNLKTLQPLNEDMDSF